MTKFSHRQAILALEHKARDFRHIAFQGKYRYNDPQEDIDLYERMAEQIEYSIASLKLLQEQEDARIRQAQDEKDFTDYAT